MVPMKTRNLFTATWVLLMGICVHAELPDYLAKCPPSGQECIVKNIQDYIASNRAGDERYGFPAVDPMKIEPLLLKQGGDGNVNVEIKMFHPLLYGLKQAKIIKIKGFGKSPDGRHEIIGFSPKLSIVSDYAVNGKVLILPIHGEGRCNFTAINSDIKLILEGASRTEDGQLYMDVKSFTFKIKPKDFNFEMENIVGTDPALNKDVNRFLNENWEIIFNDFKPIMEKGFAQVFKNLAQNVFKLTPYSDFFEI